MEDQNSNRASLTWTHATGILSAETFGLPAEELMMDCHIGVEDEHGKRKTSVRALWDTGTSTTVITPDVARKLKPKVFDTIGLNGLKGQSRAPVCAIYVLFPNGKAFGPIAAAIHELPSVDVILGMDVISIGTFTLRRKPDGGTLFTFEL